MPKELPIASVHPPSAPRTTPAAHLRLVSPTNPASVGTDSPIAAATPKSQTRSGPAGHRALPSRRQETPPPAFTHRPRPEQLPSLTRQCGCSIHIAHARVTGNAGRPKEDPNRQRSPNLLAPNTARRAPSARNPDNPRQGGRRIPHRRGNARTPNPQRPGRASSPAEPPT
jgi:hypothetical protein